MYSLLRTPWNVRAVVVVRRLHGIVIGEPLHVVDDVPFTKSELIVESLREPGFER